MDLLISRATRLEISRRVDIVSDVARIVKIMAAPFF